MSAADRWVNEAQGRPADWPFDEDADYLPEPCNTTIILASGKAEQVPMCSRCRKPVVTEDQRLWLLTEKVNLGRCTCPPYIT